MSTPEQTVRDFIAAYYSWNENANEMARLARKSGQKTGAIIPLAQQDYDRIIDRFYATGVVAQGISFGNDAMHHPERESLESTSIEDSTAIIRTRHVSQYNMESIYEYHLENESGEWKLRSLLYMDDEGSYECL